jgi:hypothetical protein
MGQVGKVLWLAVSGVFTFVAVTIAGQMISNAFNKNPWFLLELGQHLLGVQGFWIFCVAATAIWLGVLATRGANYLDRTRFHNLIQDMKKITHEVSNGLPSSEDKLLHLLSKCAAIEGQMERAGISTYSPSNPADKSTTIFKSSLIYDQIISSLRIGDKRTASKIVERYNALENGDND